MRLLEDSTYSFELLHVSLRINDREKHYLVARLIFSAVSPWARMARGPGPSILLLLISGSCLVFSCERTVIIADKMGGLGGEELTDTGGAPAMSGGEGGQGGSPGPTPPTRPRFTAPQIILELSDPDAKDQDPTLTGDLLEIYFFSDRTGNADIWTSTRTSLDSAWEPPVQVLELSSPDLDINPAVSQDGLRIWFSSQRDPDGIWFSQRSSRSDVWEAPVRVDAFGGEIAPGPSADELRMGISVHLEDTGREIYESTRASKNDPWSVPLAIEGINSPQDDSTPFLAGNGSKIFFSSARSGRGDLYFSQRSALSDPVSEPEALDELNDPDNFDSHPHLSPDGTRIFFGSERSGNTDLYEAILVP